MKELLEYLQKDEELLELKKEWEQKFSECFPGYNYDEFNGITDYKKQIKKALDANNPRLAFRKVTKLDALFEKGFFDKRCK